MPHPSKGSHQETGSITSFLIDFLAGGVSGSIAKTIAAPIERVKILLQTQQANANLKGKQYTGIFNCFSRVIKEEGVGALWRGNLSNIIRYFPTQAINFSTKDALQKYFCPYNPKTQPLQFFVGNLLSGGIAGAISLFCVYPLDFARTRLGADMGRNPSDRQFKGLGDCLRKILKTDGFRGIYRGFGISVLGIFIYRSFYFGCYDTGKKIFFNEENKNVPIWQKFLFAQLVTSTSESLSYPIDTVRRRLMMQAGRKEKIYNGTLDCAVKIFRKEGFRGFFKGNFSNICRGLGSSLVLVLYDEIQKILKPKKPVPVVVKPVEVKPVEVKPVVITKEK